VSRTVSAISSPVRGATLERPYCMRSRKGVPGSRWGMALGSTAGAGYLGGYSTVSAFLAEAVLTFLFLFVIFATTSSWKQYDGWAGDRSVLVLIHLVAIHITGTSVNPAGVLALLFSREVRRWSSYGCSSSRRW